MLTKIKQFIFYLGYELSLFQKVVVGMLGVAVVGFLVMQGTGLVANLSGSLLKGSVTDEGGTPTASTSPILSIVNVDQTALSTTGTVSVKYALGQKPESPFKFTLLVTSEEVEVGKNESESGEQTGILTVQIGEAHRTATSLTIRITAEGGGQSATDSITLLSSPSLPIVGGIPSTSPSATIPEPTPQPTPLPATPTPSEPPPVPQTGSGTLPPGFEITPVPTPVPQTGTGSVTSPPPSQCRGIGRACSIDTDCCSSRCTEVGVGQPKTKVCLPKRS